jgi:hypothetical protein
MQQLFPLTAEEPQFAFLSDLPATMLETAPVDALTKHWPWKSEFVAQFDKYWTARLDRAWPQALQFLHQARCYACAGGQWELESWVNDLIVEASAKREASRR